MPKLKVATCQFAISGNIRRNATQIKKQITQAKKQRAQVVHFPEAALSGYAGVDVKTWDGYDWDALREETEAICKLAKQKNVWVILGSAHPLTGKHKPHNCLYAILHWQPTFQNGALFTETYGDRAGCHYSEREDTGLFWSNHPTTPIGQMVRDLDLEMGGDLLSRSQALRDDAVS